MEAHMVFSLGTPTSRRSRTWSKRGIDIGQALVGSIGALAFIFALACTPITVWSRFSRPLPWHSS